MNSDIEELRQRRTSIKQALNEVHDKLVPVEIECKRLQTQYERLYKQWIEVDKRIAKLDGRLKRYRPFTSGRKQDVSPKNIEELVKKLTPQQIVELVQSLTNCKE